MKGENMYQELIQAHMLFNDPFIEVLALGCFVTYVYFSFCDGFGLSPARKLIWAVYFLSFSYLSFFASGRFDLRLIITLSSLMAFALALFQKRENRLKGK